MLGIAGLAPSPVVAQLGSLVLNIAAPVSGATVSGTTTVTANVSIVGSLTVSGVQFKLDGVNLGAEDRTAPYSIPWNTTAASNGSHTLTAVARVGLVLFSTSEPVTVTVLNDTIAPTVSIASPPSGTTVSGAITITANASDNVAVAGVQFRLDGAAIGAEDTTVPYSMDWDTAATTDGSHTLSAVARDSAGLVTTSAAVAILVANAVDTVTRVEDNASAISYTPANSWTEGYQDGHAWSGGTAALGIALGERATLSFSGTAVSWIGFRGPQTGIATVHLDGVAVATIDSYHPTEVVGAVLFTASGLTNGSHTLAIEVTRTRNDASTDFYVVVDAFDVTSRGGPADTTPPTVAISSPANGATISGNTIVTAGAADNVNVGGVRFFVDGVQLGAEDTSAPYEVSWDTTLSINGGHTVTAKARDAAGNATTSAPIAVTVSNTAQPYMPGDVLVSLETGPVQWRTAAGVLRGTLTQTVAGTGEGMAFDFDGNLYVTRWCDNATCSNGNTVEKYNNFGQPLGSVGPSFNCQPHTILFAAPGTAYIGQASCAKTIIKSPLDSTITAEYPAAEDAFGIFWMDLGADGCTMFYTSFGPNVKRYDVCGNTQLADFNVEPLPGGMGQDLRVLPDGSVLVSSGQVIVRLDATGVVTQTYEVPDEGALWAGLDLVGDGTFWVANYFSSNVYRFNLADGARLASFNTGTPANTVVGIRVVR
jgi:hypothetical protein